ncbi:hypothetical protein UB32_12600 [Mesobacillus subterraneus]|uniref:Transposase n=1 Tax=Mesobacillus subterraneus TaxID=285983 RepID=A0A0D6ZAR6_9BACI|nr:transposase [Mesobacillus subterraneus]KIY21678.1 hypothetical protein UB32_12600 [Mesobacillus subterraneus]
MPYLLYIFAPKQKGNEKEQLRHIGRYIRRSAIGLNRMEAYDGQYETFKINSPDDPPNEKGPGAVCPVFLIF